MNQEVVGEICSAADRGGHAPHNAHLLLVVSVRNRGAPDAVPPVLALQIGWHAHQYHRARRFCLRDAPGRGVAQCDRRKCVICSVLRGKPIKRPV
jgi:hypothetical protein